MADDYEYSTEEVRRDFQTSAYGIDFAGRGQDFDKWLTEIKRLAWNEGAQTAYDSFESTGIGYKFRSVRNPYNDS